MKKKLLNKYKQAARREVREGMSKLEYSRFIIKFIKPKPRCMPTFLWIWLVKKIVKTQNEYSPT